MSNEKDTLNLFIKKGSPITKKHFDQISKFIDLKYKDMFFKILSLQTENHSNLKSPVEQTEVSNTNREYGPSKENSVNLMLLIDPIITFGKNIMQSFMLFYQTLTKSREYNSNAPVETTKSPIESIEIKVNNEHDGEGVELLSVERNISFSSAQVHDSLEPVFKIGDSPDIECSIDNGSKKSPKARPI